MGSVSAVPLSAKHPGAQSGVCKPVVAFSGHAGVGDALTDVTTWGRIVDGKCLGKLHWSRIPVASSIAVCLGRKEKVKCG